MFSISELCRIYPAHNTLSFLENYIVCYILSPLLIVVPFPILPLKPSINVSPQTRRRAYHDQNAPVNLPSDSLIHDKPRMWKH